MMDQTLYNCSIISTGTIECGKVNSDKDQQKLLFFSKSSLKPSGPPMMNEIFLELEVQSSNLNLSLSVFNSLPIPVDFN